MVPVATRPQANRMVNPRSPTNILLIFAGLIAITTPGSNSQYAVWRHNLNMQSKHNLLKEIMELDLNLDAPDSQAEQKSKVQSRELKDNHLMSHISIDGQQNVVGGISKEAISKNRASLPSLKSTSGSHPAGVGAPNTTPGLGLGSSRGSRAKLSADMIRVLELLKSEMVPKEAGTGADQRLIALD